MCGFPSQVYSPSIVGKDVAEMFPFRGYSVQHHCSFGGCVWDCILSQVDFSKRTSKLRTKPKYSHCLPKLQAPPKQSFPNVGGNSPLGKFTGEKGNVRQKSSKVECASSKPKVVFPSPPTEFSASSLQQEAGRPVDTCN